MDHVAILKKSLVSSKDNLLRDIQNGSKTIESRWYKHKVAPWNNIKTGDIVYFKESGCPVSIKGQVKKVIQFEHINEEDIDNILNKFGSLIAPSSTEKELEEWKHTLQTKNYCILVFLENIETIKQFNINKKGYGISSAWLVVKDISKVKI